MTPNSETPKNAMNASEGKGVTNATEAAVIELRLRYKGDPHPDRINFEHWYVGTAWLDMHPVGSQKCADQWDAWLAASAQRQQEMDAKDATIAELQRRLDASVSHAEGFLAQNDDEIDALTARAEAAEKQAQSAEHETEGLRKDAERLDCILRYVTVNRADNGLSVGTRISYGRSERRLSTNAEVAAYIRRIDVAIDAALASPSTGIPEGEK